MFIFLILLSISFIIYFLFCRKNNKEYIEVQLNKQKNINLISMVTSSFRGTPSERYLILTLLNYGINPKDIFHDLFIYKPNGGTSQVDLVIITSVGIIVFEVKDYTGWIYGKGNQQKWTQVLSYGREKHRFYNPILQNKFHILELQRILKEEVPFYSVIVFYGDCELKDVSFIPENTFVAKSYRIFDVIENILQNNCVAAYKNKDRIINILEKTVANGEKDNIKEKHINNIENMLGSSRIFK